MVGGIAELIASLTRLQRSSKPKSAAHPNLPKNDGDQSLRYCLRYRKQSLHEKNGRGQQKGNPLSGLANTPMQSVPPFQQ